MSEPSEADWAAAKEAESAPYGVWHRRVIAEALAAARADERAKVLAEVEDWADRNYADGSVVAFRQMLDRLRTP